METLSNFYEIRVKGHLDSRDGAWLCGLTMYLQPDGETVLWGELVDQAALFGLLLRIRDQGIPLLSVNRVSSGSGDRYEM